jgi:hypothetical protein
MPLLSRFLFSREQIILYTMARTAAAIDVTIVVIQPVLYFGAS